MPEWYEVIAWIFVGGIFVSVSISVLFLIIMYYKFIKMTDNFKNEFREQFMEVAKERTTSHVPESRFRYGN